MKPNPYSWLYERQSHPLKEWVLDEVAKVFAAAVENFPPTLEEWERQDLKQRYEPLLEKVKPPLPSGVIRLALKLFRWEIGREYETIDAYLSGGHHQEHQLNPQHFEVAQFLWQHWTDQMMAFMEVATGKFRRKELLGLAERLERRLLPFDSRMIVSRG